MVVSVVATVVYRFTPYRQHFDPSVFGVAVSLVTFGGLRVAARA